MLDVRFKKAFLKFPVRLCREVLVNKTGSKQLKMMRSNLGVVAATAGAAFIGYCIYFDHKRRNAPDFKKKLREKRNNVKASSSKKMTNLPDPRDAQAMQKFFLHEV